MRRYLLAPRLASNRLWRIAGAVPSLHLSPRETGNWTDLISGTDLTTFSRANTQPTYELDGVGGLVGFSSGQRAIGYSPETGVRGGSIFGQRTQLLASPDAPATQSLTLSAVQHQLTLFGTGSVTLSGAATGTLTGTGASNRVSLSFTPTAGSVTFTVSGSVSRFNLTAGSVVYPHLGGAITCPADVLSIGGTNFSQWYQQAGGTLLVSASRQVMGALEYTSTSTFHNGTSSNRILAPWMVESETNSSIVVSGSGVAAVSQSSFSGVRKRTTAIRIAAYNLAISTNGRSPTVATSGALPTINTLQIGADVNGGNPLNGHIYDILYWPPGSPAENRLQQLSAAL